jgi:hypothetical protein
MQIPFQDKISIMSTKNGLVGSPIFDRLTKTLQCNNLAVYSNSSPLVDLIYELQLNKSRLVLRESSHGSLPSLERPIAGPCSLRPRRNLRVVVDLIDLMYLMFVIQQ